jgi:predicted nucleic acid-binding protein
MNDVSKFRLINAADTCSIWNILASRVLHSAAKQAGVAMCCTHFVRYECLFKSGQLRPERVYLQERLRSELNSSTITVCNIELEDLQDIEVLNKRKNVSKGELSSMILAKRIGHAFMTDDKKAASLAGHIMPRDFIQSTPHLLGWLYFHGRLQDSDKDKILSELQQHERSLQPHIDRAYEEALRCRLMSAR